MRKDSRNVDSDLRRNILVDLVVFARVPLARAGFARVILSLTASSGAQTAIAGRRNFAAKREETNHADRGSNETRNRKCRSGETQRTYARLAGILFLGAILLAFAGGSILSRVAGSGTLAETAARVAASERLYRVALSTVLIATLSSSLLAFALYVTLRPVSRLLAQLAMIFSLEDSFLALIVRMCGFVRIHLYVSAQTVGAGAGPIAAQALADLMRTIAGTAETLGGICFGAGSALFFALFFKSRYIPRFLSALGICASVIWTALYIANLVFPEQHALFQSICLPPMALADIATGLYLILFAVKADSPRRSA